MEKANHKLQSLLALWNEKRREREMPSRADLAVGALRPWLGNLALIDMKDGEDAIFRLCGTNLHSRFEGEMTHQKLEALEDHIAASLRNGINEMRATRQPTQIKHEARTINSKAIFHELCLPLADDGVNMDTVLFASYPEQSNQR